MKKSSTNAVLVLLATACLFAAGCDVGQPQSVSSSSNPDYRIAFLFEHDGCRVYRFTDNWSSRYFANCGASSSTSWNESCGKNCTRQMDVPTSQNPSSAPVTAQ